MDFHNFGRVFGFEVVRKLRKPSFWALSLSVPVLIGLVFALVAISNQSGISSAEEQAQQRFEFTYTDRSGLVNEQIATGMGGRKVGDDQRAIADVREGRSEAHLAFPADPSKDPTQAYGREAGVFANGKYEAVAQTLLKASVARAIGDPRVAQVAAGGTIVTTTTYRNGADTGGILGFVAPLVFLVLFYLSITMLGNQMLNVTMEEKENRVTEMILTTIKPTTLIAGKVCALVVVGLVQAAVFLLPVVFALTIGRDTLQIPQFSLSELVLDPGRMVAGALLFVAGFILFTGLLVAIGAVMPTAQDAGGAFAVVIIAMFVPFYAIQLVFADPRGLVSTVFTYFPLTAPITAMLRNAGGTLELWEFLVVLAILLGSGVACLALGVRLFRTGSISYDVRLDVRKALGLKSAN